MRRFIRTLLVAMTVTMLSTVGVMAGNVNSTMLFTTNGQKVDTSGAGVKADDEDYNAYVTTLSESPVGTKSTVFKYGGKVHARTRLQKYPNDVYSPLFTFTSYQRQVKRYDTGMAQFDENYILRAETEGANYNGSRLIQAFKWCP